MAKYPNAIGGTYTSLSPIADCERTVNFYVEQMESKGAKAEAVLYPCPGTQLYVTTAGLNGRGIFELDGRCFVTIGSNFYELTAPGVATLRGTIATDTHPTTMCSNGDGGGEIFITSGGNGYIFDLATNTLTLERTGATSQGGMLDGYFLALDANTSTLFLSDLLDGQTWDPTQFAQRNIAPDPWVAMIVNYREIWLLGTETTEVWFNAGTFPFPYQPHPSGLIPYGIAASFSIRNIGGTLVWLARTINGTGQVVSATGFTPQVISTHAMQAELATYPLISDAIGDSFEFNGHTFYVLTFPTAGHTWIYDFATKVWVEWLTWVSELNQYVAWRPLFHAFAFGKHLICDRSSGNVYDLTTASAIDVDGRFIRRLRRFPGITNELKRAFYGSFELYLETGQGLVSGQGSDPQIALRTSDDGGKTWGNERWAGSGRIGQYKARASWERLGSGRDRVFEVVMTDPVPWRVIDAFMEVRKGTS